MKGSLFTLTPTRAFDVDAQGLQVLATPLDGNRIQQPRHVGGDGHEVGRHAMAGEASPVVLGTDAPAMDPGSKHVGHDSPRLFAMKSFRSDPHEDYALAAPMSGRDDRHDLPEGVEPRMSAIGVPPANRYTAARRRAHQPRGSS